MHMCRPVLRFNVVDEPLNKTVGLRGPAVKCYYRLCSVVFVVSCPPISCRSWGKLSSIYYSILWFVFTSDELTDGKARWCLRLMLRSEERRVGKECRSRLSPCQ